MKTVIMAGGAGTRISELFPNIPKPLIRIEGVPVLEREILGLKEQGFCEIILTLSHMADQIMAHFGDGSALGVHIEYYVEQTHFEYMYNYKYPTEEVPEGGYEAVAEGLQKEIYGYTFDVTVLGITKDNPFFDTGDLPDNDTDVVVSSAVAIK